MKTLDRLINARLVKAYFITNIVLANLHVGIVMIYCLATGDREQANLFHLLGLHLPFPILAEERFLIPSFIAIAALIAIVYWFSKSVHVRLSHWLDNDAK